MKRAERAKIAAHWAEIHDSHKACLAMLRSAVASSALGAADKQSVAAFLDAVGSHLAHDSASANRVAVLHGDLLKVAKLLPQPVSAQAEPKKKAAAA